MRSTVTEPRKVHRPQSLSISLTSLNRSLPKSLSQPRVSLNLFIIHSISSTNSLKLSIARPQPSSITPSLNRTSPLSCSLTIAHDTTQEMHKSMVSKENRVNISPSAVTTAEVKLKSSFLASSIQVF